MLKRNEKLDNKNHDLAKYLKANGWKETLKTAHYTTFLDSFGNHIALINYDNENCTYRVFTK